MRNRSGPARATMAGRASKACNDDAANNILKTLSLSFLKSLLSIALIFSITSNGASWDDIIGVDAAEAEQGGNASEESMVDRYYKRHHSTLAGAESTPSKVPPSPHVIRNGDRFDVQYSKNLGSTTSVPSLTERIKDDDSSLTVKVGKSKLQRPLTRRTIGKKNGLLDARKQRTRQQVAHDPNPVRSPDEQEQIHLAGRTREHDMGLRAADDQKTSTSPPLVATEQHDVGTSTTSTHSPSIEEQLPPYKLTTSFDGTKMGYGIMFDVTAASPSPTSSCSSFTSISIESIDIHLSLNNNNIPIRVYVTPETYSGKEHSPSEWESVAYHVVQGQGRGNPTPVPAEAFDEGRKIELTPGETIGMYVTLVDSSHIVYSESSATATMRDSGNATSAGALNEDNKGTDREDVMAKSNCHLGISTGVGIKFLFGEAYRDRDFNGVLRYRVHYHDDHEFIPLGEGVGGRGNASLQQQQQQPTPLRLHSLDLAEERRRRRGQHQQEGDSAVANNHERRVTSHGIVFEVSSAFSRAGTGDGDEAEASVTTIRGMALRTLLREGEWARVEVYTKSGSYEEGSRSLGGGDGENYWEPREGIGGEWIRILDEFVHGGDYSGADSLRLEGSNNTVIGAGQLSHFVEPVRVLDGGDGVQSFFVVMSSPVLLSSVTDDPIGEEQATPLSSSALNVLSGRSVDSYPADPSSMPYSSATTPPAGEEVSNKGGRTMLFDGILLYSSTRQEGNLTKVPSTASPTPSPTAPQAFTSYPTASSLLSTYTDIRTLTTGYNFADERLSHGNIFDLVVAEDRVGPIVITTLSFHVDLRRVGDDVTDVGGDDGDTPKIDATDATTTSYRVKVYSKPGTYRNGVDDAALWEMVADVTLSPGEIHDEGTGTTIPVGRFRNVLMEPGSTRAFLLVFSTPNVVTSPYVGPDGGTNSPSSSFGGTFSVAFNTSDGGAMGDDDDGSTVYASNSDLSILVGSGVGRYGFDVDKERHFNDLFDDRVWHGTVHYRTTEETSTPTATPTVSPTIQRTPTPTRPEALTHRTDRELLTTWVGGAVGRRCEFDLRVADSDERNKHHGGGGGAIVVRSLDLAVATNSSSDGKRNEEHVEKILQGISLHIKHPIGDDGATSSADWTERLSTASLLRHDDGVKEDEGQRGYFVVNVELNAPLVLADGAGTRMSVVLPTSDLVYTEVEPDSDRGGEGDVYASNIDVGLLIGVCSTIDSSGDKYHDDESGQPITLPDGQGDDIAAVHHPAGTSIPGVFNGIVHYSVRTASPTSAPTHPPTLLPTIGTTGDGTTKAVVAQQMITLKGISRRRLLQWRHNRRRKESGNVGSRATMMMRWLASSTHLSPVLEDERAIEFFEDTVLAFVREWIRRTNPTLAVRQVVVSTDVTEDEVTLLHGDGREDGNERDDLARRLRRSRRSLVDDVSTKVPSLRGSMGRSRQSSPSRPPNTVPRALREGQDDSIDDPPSLNVYTTITGDYTPPPDVVFDALVEDTFVDNGEVFVRELNEDPAFEEVTGVETKTVRFPLPPLPTTSSDGTRNDLASLLSPGTTMGLVLIITFVIGGLAVALLICGCTFFTVRRRRKKKERKRRDIVRESERLRSASVELCDDDRYHRVGGTDAASEGDTTDDESDYGRRPEGRRRPIEIATGSALGAAVATGSSMNSEDGDHGDDASGVEDNYARRREGDAEETDKDSTEEQERKKSPVLAPRTRASVSRRRQRKKRTNAPRVTPRKKKVKASAA